MNNDYQTQEGQGIDNEAVKVSKMFNISYELAKSIVSYFWFKFIK